MIWTDERTRQTVDFYSHSAFGRQLWDGQFKQLARNARAVPNDLVGERAVPAHQGRPGAAAADGWRVIWRSSNGVIVIWQR